MPIDTPTLGDRSYLVHDGQVALVIDPQRDIDRVLDLAGADGVRITHIFETHIHNDYVTGGLALARETGAAYHVNADDPVAYERTGVRDGDVDRGQPGAAGAGAGHPGPHLHPPVLRAGGARHVDRGVHRRVAAVRLHRTPGPARTRPHPRPSAPPVRVGAAAGRGTARPDPGDADPRVRQLLLGHPVRGHRLHHRGGEGTNPVLTQDEQRYVAELLAGLDAFPAYYAQMGPANTAGPSAPDLSPPALADARELRRRLGDGRVAGRSAHPHRLRRRSRARHPELRARRVVRHLPGLADPLGHPGDPAG